MAVGPIQGVRYNYETEEFEGRCADCGRYLALVREFWYVNKPLSQCKACRNVQKRIAEQLRLVRVNEDPKITARRAYQREWKRRRKESTARKNYLIGLDRDLREEVQRRKNRLRMRIERVA